MHVYNKDMPYKQYDPESMNRNGRGEKFITGHTFLDGKN